MHNPHNIIYNKYPAKVLAAFSDAFGDNPKVAEFVTWPKDGVVRVVLGWMLACCTGNGLQQVKDIDLDLSSLVSAKGDGELSRFFKTAYLYDFAQEYKIKHLEDKLKRELEFQAKVYLSYDTLASLPSSRFSSLPASSQSRHKSLMFSVQGKFALRLEEIYDMANYFWQPNRDDTAINLMLDSIARGYVKGDIRGKRRNMYDEEMAIWASDTKKDCECAGQETESCIHNDLPEMLSRRIKYFEKPENSEELNEVFGGKKLVEDTGAENGAGEWANGEGFAAPSGIDTWNGAEASGNGADWDGAAKLDEEDKENQASRSWADDANGAAENDQWGIPAATSGLAGGW